MNLATSPVPATYSRKDQRGTFVEIVNRGPWETVITGTMNAGAVLGDHYHKVTDLFFFLVEGRCRVDIECLDTGLRRNLDLEPGEGLHIAAFEAHAVRFEAPSRFIMLKSHAFDPDLPDIYDHPVRSREREAPAAC